MNLALADRFEKVVDAHGELVAIDSTAGTTTYSELERRANRVAGWLSDAGFEHGDRIGVALWNRPEHLEVLLGTFKAGMVPVNVNCRYTSAEIEALLCNAGARAIVHEATLTLAITEASVGHDWIPVALGDDYEAALANRSEERPDIRRSGDDPYILYTGGSTGLPKGVMWRQSDLFAAAMSASERRRPGSRILPASPLTHGTAQWTTMSTLLSGGTVVFGPARGLDPVALWSRVASAGVTRLVIVGDAFARPLLEALDANGDRWDLSALVAITSGGARWSATVQQGLLEHLPHVAMVNSFGASETGGQGSQVRFAGSTVTEQTGLLRFTPDEATTVLDADLRPVTAGSGRIGVLAQHGAVPLGYLGDPERSARIFPVIDGTRYAIPGDLATVEDDGDIVVLGRDRNVINTGGEKVFAEEIEATLLAHRAVADAVAVGIPDERWEYRVGALVQVHEGAALDADEVRDHCAASLASFKIPRHVEFVRTIRHLATGKLDRAWAADTMADLMTPKRND